MIIDLFITVIAGIGLGVIVILLIGEPLRLWKEEKEYKEWEREQE